MAKITKTKFIAALDGTGAILSQIAKKLNCSRQAVHEFIKRTPVVIPFVEHERERILDVMETGMINKAIEGDFKAQSFYLKTIGKSRGFTEKIETELTGGLDNKITFELVQPDVKKLDHKEPKQIEGEKECKK